MTGKSIRNARRDGRNASHPFGDPDALNPYSKSKGWNAQFLAKAWREGWDSVEHSTDPERKSRVNPDADLDEQAVDFAMLQVEHYGVRENDLRFAIAAYLNYASREDF